MKKYFLHISLVLVLLSTVVLAINVMVFYSKNVTEYLYIFDLTYAIVNSIHFVAPSISDKGIYVKDEASGK
jgi:hypothetical protein